MERPADEVAANVTGPRFTGVSASVLIVTFCVVKLTDAESPLPSAFTAATLTLYDVSTVRPVRRVLNVPSEFVVTVTSDHVDPLLYEI